MSSKLALVLQLKQREVDAAARQVRQLQGDCVALAQQLKELALMREDLAVSAGAHTSAEDLHRRSAFRDKIREAEHLSATNLARMEQTLRQARAVWRTQFEAHRALRDVVSERLAVERAHQRRRSQRV